MIFTFKKSTRKNKKYMVFYNDKWIHFGDKRYQHFEDKTGLGEYSYLNHLDKDRRKRYLARAKKIKNKKGQLTYLDKNSPNYWAVKFLW